MATNFPASLDTLTNPTSSDSLSSPSHSAQHANVNDAVEALQAKVGVDSSAVTSSHDYLIADHASRLTTLEGASTGKILQVVRATDTIVRTTTSSSLVDANISVTITPTATSSNILLWWSVHIDTLPGTQATSTLVITDSSNNIIDGTGNISHGLVAATRNLLRSNFIAWDSPATTSATTYKGRFQANAGATVELENSTSTGQLFALEISA